VCTAVEIDEGDSRTPLKNKLISEQSSAVLDFLVLFYQEKSTEKFVT